MAAFLSGKIVLDTNVFIDYLRAGLHADWVAGHAGNTVRFLSSIVLFELRVGADTKKRRRVIDHVKAAFPASRLIAPGAELYDRAGTLFRHLHGSRDAAGRLGALNDLLIALTAWQLGATVVTSNVDDFRAIARHVRGLRWIAP